VEFAYVPKDRRAVGSYVGGGSASSRVLWWWRERGERLRDDKRRDYVARSVADHHFADHDCGANHGCDGY
jgi:hypothetical protein